MTDNGFLFVVRYQPEYYYIGITGAMHQDTFKPEQYPNIDRKYTPIQVVERVKIPSGVGTNEAERLEDILAMKYMKKFGLNKVKCRLMYKTWFTKEFIENMGLVEPVDKDFLCI